MDRTLWNERSKSALARWWDEIRRPPAAALGFWNRRFRDRMDFGQALILNDDYIYRYILAGGRSEEGEGRSYGASTYYGRKVIFKTRSGAVHVLTIPTTEETADPQQHHFISFEKNLQIVDLLHCDMYDDALFPVALANKLVSLSAHPSQRILERFAVHSVQSNS